MIVTLDARLHLVALVSAGDPQSVLPTAVGVSPRPGFGVMDQIMF